MSTIANLLARCKDPLVGVQYVFEICTGNRRSNYFICILCNDVEFENHSNTIKHLMSFQHRVAYLDWNYPKTMKPAQRLLQSEECMNDPSPWIVERVEFICKEIEKRFPRRQPNITPFELYAGKRANRLKSEGPRKHSKEDFIVDTFVEADVEHQLQLLGLSIVDFGSVPQIPTSRPEVAPPKEKRPTKPPASAYRRSDLEDAKVIAEYHKRYSAMFSDVLANQQKYQKDPHSHPKYPAEWDKFWKARSQEFDSAGKDPYDHDFTREWSLYWLERVKELEKESIDRREREIRHSLNLPEDLEIPSLEQGLQKIIGNGPENADDAPTNNNKRSSQFDDNQGDSKRSRNQYDPHEDTRRSEVDLRHTLPRPRSTYQEQNFDRDERQRDTDDRQASSSEQDYVQKPSASDYDEDDTKDPVTTISVLRLLSAFEDLLGNSLGPKVVDLLSKAVALEKVRANLSDDLLVSEENSILLDTVKEKMKGLLMTGIVKSSQVPAVRRVIAHVNKISKIIEKRLKAKQKRAIANARQNLGLSREKEQREQEIAAAEFRKDVYKQLETSISLQGKLITPDQLDTLTNVYIQKHTANDTPYLFGIQMGSRFPDLPRNDGNHMQGNQHRPDDFGQNSSSRYGTDNNNPHMSNNFGGRNDEFRENSHHSQSHGQPNDNGRFGQNDFYQYNQEQFRGGNQQRQQWSNPFNQNDSQQQNQQQFPNDFGRSQQFPGDFDNRRQQQDDFQQGNNNGNHNGNQFEQINDNDNQQFVNQRFDGPQQQSRRGRGMRSRLRAEKFTKNSLQNSNWNGGRGNDYHNQ